MQQTTGSRSAEDVRPGQVAPSFAAPASTGRMLRLEDLLGTVPVALTLTGTLRAGAADELIVAFNRILAEFGRRHAQSLIVTPQGPVTVRRRRRTGINVPLLADDDGQLVERYAGSATFPVTVLIDTDGTVRSLIEGGSADEHAAAVLERVKEARR